MPYTLNPKLTLSEKLEFLYLAPYYFQSALFLVGTLCWIISEAVFKVSLPFWTAVWGWSLVLTNFISLPLMNTVGLFMEEAEQKDYLGILPFILLSYILAPFQAYAAVKGFLESEEGPWFRTPKTGRITDIFHPKHMYRWLEKFLTGSPALQLKSQYTGAVEQNWRLRAIFSSERFGRFDPKPRSHYGVGKLGLSLLIIATLIIHSLAVGVKPVQAWYNNGYVYRKLLTIDRTQVSGTTDLTSFPVLVAFSDTSLRTVADGGRVQNSSGFDIIFVASDDTTKLDHEIESYTSSGSTGTIVMWVRFPTLHYATDDTFYMYYGNSSISTSQENKTGVWDTNYKAVWHFKEDPSGTAPQMSDSTSNGLNGTSNGSMTTSDQVTAQINGGLDFDGTNDTITFTQTDVGTVNTTEFWLNFRDAGDGVIVGRTDSNYTAYIDGASSTSSIYLNPGSGGYVSVVHGGLTSGTFYHLVVARNGTSVSFYKNGSQIGTTQTLPTNPSLSLASIGAHSQSNDFYTNGVIDEVRLSTSARTSDWITTEYNNQNNQGTGSGKFIKTLDSEEQVPELLIMFFPVAVAAPLLIRYLYRRRSYV